MLTEQNYEKLLESILKNIHSKGKDYYLWKNSPKIKAGLWAQIQGYGADKEEVYLSADQVSHIFEEKIKRAYTEKLVMSIVAVGALIKNGYNVRIVHFSNKEFESEINWIVIVIEGMPVFHISSMDLDFSIIKDLIEFIPSGSEDFEWKDINKVGEFEAILKGSLSPGLDLVDIARKASL